MKKTLTSSLLILMASVNAPHLLADNSEKLIENVMNGGVTVDLRNPTFCDGVLTSDSGGIITAPGIRIQAKNIVYTRKTVEGKTIATIEAEENLILEFNDYVFIGTRLEYDFEARSGILYDGRTSLEPWFFGGEKIYLQPDGSYMVYQAFVTTSENVKQDWAILANRATLTDGHLVEARQLELQIARYPVLWLPKFKTDLDYIYDNPLQYEFRAGSQGPRVSVAYEIFNYKRLKTFARLDYRLKRGWGGGIETFYRSADHREMMETVNFIARDAKSTGDHHVATRYRFQGIYHRDIPTKNLTLDFSYDKLSDKEMATDYRERGLDYETAGRTQFLMRKQADWWITNFMSRVRVNRFQTIKQELPTLQMNIIPFTLGNTGIISENQFYGSYLDFRYANSIPDAHDYSSSRFGFYNTLYRPFHLGAFTLTPEVGDLFIYEGNSPQRKPRWVGLGIFATELDTRMYGFYHDYKHVIRPYIRYEYFTCPTTSPKEHYIFDIDDGWYRLNMTRFGVGQNFYLKGKNGLITRFLEADIYGNAFIDSHTMPAFIPKIYGLVAWYPTPYLKETIDIAYDFDVYELDHINLRTAWTINPDAAVSAEYRHRSSFSWRKADPNNYFLDAFRSIKELRHSQLSDRRDTLLFHLFYRIHPSVAVEFESRHGWLRRHESSYNEYEIDFFARLRSAWNIKISYQHLEDDDRFTFAFSLGTKRPDESKYENLVPFIEF